MATRQMTPALAADRATVPELPAWVLSDPPRGGAASRWRR